MNIFQYFSCKVYNPYQPRIGAETKYNNSESATQEKSRSSFFSFGKKFLGAMHQAMSSTNKMTLTQRSIIVRDTDR